MKTIIVPVDFSAYSEYALETAAILAKKANAEILVVHMLELATVQAYGKQTESDMIERGMYYIKMAERKFDEFLDKDYLGSVPVTPIIRHFKVFSELGEIATEYDADLIVMGSQGASGLKEFFVGSNTEKVVRHSHVPVLVVKNKPLNWSLNKVVFATDFTEAATPAFQRATRILEELGAYVELLYVNLPGDGFRTTDEMETAAEKFLMSADGSLDRLADVRYISDKTAENGILKYAHKVNADLIAITTHGRTGLSHLLEGSISEDLANKADLPILSLKKE